MYYAGAFRLLKYLMFAKHKYGHGIHSPFVFKLITRVFRNKFNPGVVLIIESIRKKNLADQRKIIVRDLGAGSVRMKGMERKVSDIAGNSSLPRKYGILLASLSSEFGKKSIIEFGTSLGFSAMYLAAGNSSSTVHTMEGCPATAEIAGKNFLAAGIGNISLSIGSFDELLPVVTEKAGTPGLVFIDGDHRKEAVLRYFDIIYAASDEYTVVVLDDIHSSREMEEAWKYIKSDTRVTVTVDIFRMGIVFFRKGISCANYIIRY